MTGPAARPRVSPILIVAPVAVFLLLSIVLGTLGGEHRWTDAVIALAGAIAPALLAAIYLLSALGWGAIVQRFVAPAREAVALQCAIGLSILLSLSHLLGVLGLFSGWAGRAVAGGTLLVGIFALLSHRTHFKTTWASRIADTPEPNRTAWMMLLGAPTAAVLFVAAASPPGWLWDSEFGNYDSLSYHLQLPKEWLALGALAPLDHNVYSYLPSYIEAAFMHLGALVATPPDYPELLSRNTFALSSQMLHAGLALVAALLTARAAASMLPDDARDTLAAPLAGLALFATPWMIVVGSLSYNEMGMLALFAGAMIAASERELSPVRRAIIAGVLVGVACGCKPTALLFAGAPVGIVLLARAPGVRAWPAMIAAGSAAGLLALAPWLIRNFAASGNPVFPVASSIFGSGHWSAEQVARYQGAHFFSGSLIDRLKLLVLPDETGARRGLTHPQYLALFPLALAAAAVALASARTRGAALIITAGLAVQIGVWLFTTHLQSRFLLPLAVPAAMLIALAMGSAQPGRAGTIFAGIGAVLVIVQSLATLTIYAQQRGSAPSALLTIPIAELSGVGLKDAFSSATPEEQQAFLESASPERAAAVLLAPEQRLVLIGSGAPFYIARPPEKLIYHTTWDASPFARLATDLADAALLVDLSEIRRLTRDGWYDPSVDEQTVRALLESGRYRVLWASPDRRHVLAVPSGSTP